MARLVELPFNTPEDVGEWLAVLALGHKYTVTNDPHFYRDQPVSTHLLEKAARALLGDEVFAAKEFEKQERFFSGSLSLPQQWRHRE